ncbi:MAG: hypothetical protein Q9174_002003 [Haloplaca sp. 1 TL-2023]
MAVKNTTTFYGTYLDSWVRERDEWKINARTTTVRVSALLLQGKSGKFILNMMCRYKGQG